MRPDRFIPTSEQVRVIERDGCAFVVACPGAGKTYVLVERARRLLKGGRGGKGVSLLSFTTAAISELQSRLQREGLLSSSPFPHYIGTFDSFLWQFLVAPLGVPGYGSAPRLVPDKEDLDVRPAPGMRELPLRCFDRTTGEIISAEAAKFGFDPATSRSTRAYVSSAKSLRERLLRLGQLDFEDVRAIALLRLSQEPLASRLRAALAGRFGEVVVDEAQDCNPTDLKIVDLLRRAGIAVKVVSDPNQAIYGFRGGVAEELAAFAENFSVDERLALRGNFRSTDIICRAICALRPIGERDRPDDAVGEYRDVAIPVAVFSYSGAGVPASIGHAFQELCEARGLRFRECPLLAKTRQSAGNAVGQPAVEGPKNLTFRLALAVADFYFSFERGGQQSALDKVHRAILELQGRLDGSSYRQLLVEERIEAGDWRPLVLRIVRELRFNPKTDSTPEAWLVRARTLLEPLVPPGGRSIAQRLPRNDSVGAALIEPPQSTISARTIHSVKGAQFPGVCVVMTVRTTKSILDYLETGRPAASAEDARGIYVAASRAERLLVIAAPRSQVPRLASRLALTGTKMEIAEL